MRSKLISISKSLLFIVLILFLNSCTFTTKWDYIYKGENAHFELSSTSIVIKDSFETTRTSKVYDYFNKYKLLNSQNLELCNQRLVTSPPLLRGPAWKLVAPMSFNWSTLDRLCDSVTLELSDSNGSKNKINIFYEDQFCWSIQLPEGSLVGLDVDQQKNRLLLASISEAWIFDERMGIVLKRNFSDAGHIRTYLIHGKDAMLDLKLKSSYFFPDYESRYDSWSVSLFSLIDGESVTLYDAGRGGVSDTVKILTHDAFTIVQDERQLIVWDNSLLKLP